MMLVVYNQNTKNTWFETEFSDRILMSDTSDGPIEIDRYKFIVGNDLCVLNGITNQTCIDVCKLGLDCKMIEKYGLEAIVYVYNNWYIPNSPYMNVYLHYDKFMLRDVSPDARKIQIDLPSSNKRFNIIDKEIKNAAKQPNFIGAVWPTCHYMTDTSKMWLIFGNRITKIESIREVKPIV